MKNNSITKYLRCPCCKASMAVSDDTRSLVCLGEGKRHSFDFSSKGYVNLARAQGSTGDSKQAVRSRSDFLNKGYYAPVAQRLVEIIKKYVKGGLVIDAGCGEGYYTAQIAECGYECAGIDLSKFAIDSLASRLKCKTNDKAFAAVASIFDMPFCDSCADVVLSIFAPCAEDEMYRVLSDNGVLIVVSAGKEHLMGLKKAIYKSSYENDVRADMPKGMEKIDFKTLSYTVTLETNEDILNLFSMTPYYWRTSREDSQKLVGLEKLVTEIDINFTVYKKSNIKEQ